MFRQRMKTSLVVACLLACLAGPLLVGALNRWIDSYTQAGIITPAPQAATPVEQACLPPISQELMDALDKLTPGQPDDPAVSVHMAELFLADQAPRHLPWIVDPHEANQADLAHRQEVLSLLQKGQIVALRDLVYAAFIFQHGDCPEHYLLANRLAQIAMDSGYADARWIYAATLDRYLMSLGQPQKYGTQKTWIDGKFQLYPVDPATTDEERARDNVPLLPDEASMSIETLSEQAGTGLSQQVSHRQWLGSWWLTLIGACYALLSMLIGLFLPKPGDRLGWVCLGLAALIYLGSTLGHYIQVNAMVQGLFTAQQQTWRLINLSAVLVWISLAALAGRSIYVHRQTNDR